MIFFRNEKNYSPSEVSLAYGESAYAVRWIAEKWGIDAFWAVAKEYDKSRDFPAAIQNNLGQSWDQTQSDFLTWLKAQVS